MKKGIHLRLYFLYSLIIILSSCNYDDSVYVFNNALFQKDISTIQYGNKFLVKDVDEGIFNTEWNYLAFFNGTVFNNEEIHVGCLSRAHMAIENGDGCIIMFKVRNDKIIEAFFPEIDYSQYSGEFRDPNISVINNGDNLLLCTYLAISNKVVASYYFILDRNYNILTSKIISSEYIVWGNSLETPDHFIIKTAYDLDGNLYVLKSNQRVSSSLDLTFSIVKTFKENAVLSEATMSYVNEHILMFVRTGGNSGSETYSYWTDDLEGESGWSDVIKTGVYVHSPEMPIRQIGNNAFFAGGYVKNESIREPCVCVWNCEKKIVEKTVLLDEFINGFGGYPSLINIDRENGVFSMMYYDDYINASTAVYYIRFKMQDSPFIIN